MTLETKLSKYPTYLDILLNIVLSAWIFLACVSAIYAFSLSGFTAATFILAVMFTLFCGGVITLLFGGLIAFPLWVSYRPKGKVSQFPIITITSLTAVFIATGIIWLFPMDFSGSTIGFTKFGIAILFGAAVFGGLSGWRGFQIAKRKVGL